MKKEWQKLVLEVLDVKMTMATTTGTHVDGDYTHGQIVPIIGGIPAVLS